MAVKSRYILHQGPVLGAIARTVFAAARQTQSGASGPPQTPGPEITMEVPALPKELVRDYIRHVGGDPSSYKGRLPPHLFPQWVFPMQARTLAGVSYPLAKVLNGGCKMEIKAPLPLGEPLICKGRLVEVDDNGSRAILHMRAVTGTREVPEALVAHLQAIVPLGGKASGGKANGAPKKKKAKARVPEGARELAYWRIGPKAGLDFAKLTGDFNPVHWVEPYAKASGFRSCILHGFATMARAVEGVNRGVFAGDTSALTSFDCRFTRPLLLPAKVGLYLDGNDVYVGDAPGGPAYLVGSYGTQSLSAENEGTP